MPYTQNGLPFVFGSDTSEDAANLSAHSAAAHRALIRAFIKSAIDGVTCDEIEVALNLRHQTASARIRELVLDELIFDTGARRKTRSGASARVYSATRQAL